MVFDKGMMMYFDVFENGSNILVSPEMQVNTVGLGFGVFENVELTFQDGQT